LAVISFVLLALIPDGNMLDSTRTIKKLKKFKQGIGIAEKSQNTRRDCWGGNVNHKYLF